MIEIIPAIMPKTYEKLKEQIAQVRGLVQIVQLDLMDGKFTQGITWPFKDTDEQSLNNILDEKEGMPFWEDIDFELDLMVSDAWENFPFYMKLGPKRMVFHIEAITDIPAFKEFLEGIDMYTRDATEFGIAINTTTPIETIYPLVNAVDFVQMMGIEHIGKQGEPFDNRVLASIKALREKFSGVVISVDGAVNKETLPLLYAAGAERFVVGSDLFNSPYLEKELQDLESLV